MLKFVWFVNATVIAAYCSTAHVFLNYYYNLINHFKNRKNSLINFYFVLFFCFFYIIQAKTMLLLFYLVKHLIFCVRKRKEKEEINKLKYLNRISLFHRSLKHLSIISWNSKITFIKEKIHLHKSFFLWFYIFNANFIFFHKIPRFIKIIKK